MVTGPLKNESQNGIPGQTRNFLLPGFWAFMILSILSGTLGPKVLYAQSAPLTVYHADYRQPNDSLHIFLKNNSKTLISITNLQLTNVTGSNITWQRLRPEKIPAGEIAELTLKLKEGISSSPVNLSVDVGGKDKLNLVVSPKTSPLRITTAAFAPDLRTLYVYVKAATSLLITAIFIDGEDYSPQAGTSLPAKFDRGLAFIKVRLSSPLTVGSYKVIGVRAGENFSACQIRVWPAQFLIGTYGAHNFEDYKSHGLNHYLSFYFVKPPQLAQLSALGMTAGSTCFPYLEAKGQKDFVRFNLVESGGQIGQSKDSPALAYYCLTDEPDCADHKFGGAGSVAMEMVSRASFCEQKDSKHPSFIQIDNSYKPKNFYIYGEIPDLVGSHRYVLGQSDFLADLTYYLRLLKQASEPRPMFWVTQFKNLKADRTGRPPTYAEMRLQAYLALAEGAKGIIHYIHSGSAAAGEGGRDKKLWDEMTGLHRELAILGPVVALGEVADLATATPGTVRAAAIRSDDKIVLILLNETYKTSYATFEQSAVSSIKVSLTLPPGLQIRNVYALEGTNKQPVPFKVTGSSIAMEIKSLQDAKAFLLE